jgi:hypothetical protein
MPSTTISTLVIAGGFLLGIIWVFVDWRIFDEALRGLLVFCALMFACIIGVAGFNGNIQTFTSAKYDIDAMAEVYQPEEKHVKEAFLSYNTLEHNGWTDTWTYYIVDRDEKKHEYDQYLLSTKTITVEVREE